MFDHAFLAVVNSRLKPSLVYVIVCKVSFDEPPPSPDLTAHIKGASQRAQTESLVSKLNHLPFPPYCTHKHDPLLK